jgi:hypothetical protein
VIVGVSASLFIIALMVNFPLMEIWIAESFFQILKKENIVDVILEVVVCQYKN